MRITLLDYRDDVTAPAGYVRHSTTRYVAFDVHAEKDGRWWTVFSADFFRLHDCFGESYAPLIGTSKTRGFEFSFWIGDSDVEGLLYFELPRQSDLCDLVYHSGRGEISFRFP